MNPHFRKGETLEGSTELSDRARGAHFIHWGASLRLLPLWSSQLVVLLINLNFLSPMVESIHCTAGTQLGCEFVVFTLLVSLVAPVRWGISTQHCVVRVRFCFDTLQLYYCEFFWYACRGCFP